MLKPWPILSGHYFGCKQSSSYTRHLVLFSYIPGSVLPLLKAHLHQSNQRAALKAHEEGRVDTQAMKDYIIFPHGFYNTKHNNS